MTSFNFSESCLPRTADLSRCVMSDERVHGLAVQEHIELHEVRLHISGELVIHRSVPLGEDLSLS